MNIYEKINLARVKFIEANPKKTGTNNFQGFEYFELKDILEVYTPIAKEIGLTSIVSTSVNDYGRAEVLEVVNCEKPEEKVYFTIQIPAEIDLAGIPENKTMQNVIIQGIGKTRTYLKRYLYMNLLDIYEPDIIDGKDNSSTPNKSKNKKNIVKSNGGKEISTTALENYGNEHLSMVYQQLILEDKPLTRMNLINAVRKHKKDGIEIRTEKLKLDEMNKIIQFINKEVGFTA